MSGKAEEITIKLKALLDKNFGGNLKNFSDKVRKISDETSKLAEQNEKLSKFKKNFEGMGKSGKKISELNKELGSARERLQKIEQEMQKATKVTKQMELEHRKASQTVKKLEDKISHQKNAFEKYRLELKKLKIPLQDYRRELDRVRKAEAQLELKQKIKGKIEGFKSSVANIGRKALNMAKVGIVAGTALAGAIGYSSANSYLDFNKQMLKVKAISGATQEEYKKLESAAIKLGATTAFTAGEAAAGMEKFALAGFKTNEIIKVMPSMLNLAAASGEDLMMISDLISDHLNSFNMSVEDTGRFSDILANTMSRSNTNIEMLGEALKYASAGAKDLNIPLETISATVGLMGDQAIKAGMAGTNLKQAFSKLADSGIQNKLSKMGIHVKNNKGEFVGFIEFMEQLEKKTSKMSGIDKLGFLKDIFGDRGSTAINKILTAQKEFNGETLKGVAVLKAFSNENANSMGKAEEMANVMLKGPSGAMTLLKSAWESVKLGIGGAIFNEKTLSGLKIVTDYLAELSNVIRGELSLDPVNQKLQTIFEKIINFKDGLLTALEPLQEGFKTLFPEGVGGHFLSILEKLSEFIIFMAGAGANTFKILAPLIKTVLDLINIIGVDKIAVFIAAFMGMNKVTSLTKKIFQFIDVIKSVGGVIPLIKTALAALGGPITWIVAAIALVGYAIYKNWDTIKKWVKAIGNYFYSLYKKIMETPFGKLIKLFFKIFSPISWLINIGKMLIENWENIKATAQVLGTMIWDFAQKYWYLLGPIGWIIKAGSYLIENWENIKATAMLIGKSIWDFAQKYWYLLGPIGWLIKAGSYLIENWEAIKKGVFDLWNTLKNAVSSIVNSISEVISQAWEKLTGFFSKIKEKILDLPFVKNFIAKVEAKKAENKNLGIDGTHANGLAYVPFNGYIAELHRGERVLTADENTNLFGRFKQQENISQNILIVKSFIAKVEAKKAENKNLGIDGTHANGLAYVPFNGYIAELHRGERVLTADENANLFGRFKQQENISQNILKPASVSTTQSSIILEQHFHFDGNTDKDTIEYASFKFKEAVKRALKELGIDEARVRY